MERLMRVICWGKKRWHHLILPTKAEVFVIRLCFTAEVQLTAKT